MRASESLMVVVVVVLAAVLAFQSLEFRYLSPQGFGPGFVPLNFAAATAVLGVLILVRARSLVSGHSDPEAPSPLRARAAATLPAVGAAALLFGATYLMRFGSVLAPLFAVMMIVSVTMLGHSLPKAAAANVATLAVVYAVFNLWLNIPLT